jgi:hypothetical protein
LEKRRFALLGKLGSICGNLFTICSDLLRLNLRGFTLLSELLQGIRIRGFALGQLFLPPSQGLVALFQVVGIGRITLGGGFCQPAGFLQLTALGVVFASEPFQAVLDARVLFHQILEGFDLALLGRQTLLQLNQFRPKLGLNLFVVYGLFAQCDGHCAGLDG